MSLARIYTRAQVGVSAPEVCVEVHIGNGLPAFHIVGLPETSVKEAKDRVRSAIENAHFIFPPQRITVNLAPADLPKEGGRFDLAIAVGVLTASGQLASSRLTELEFYGELALNGEVRAINGIIPTLIEAGKHGRCCYLPAHNDETASLVSHVPRKAVGSLQELWADLSGQQVLPLNQAYSIRQFDNVDLPDMAEVKGQEGAKRVLEIAAAGAHNVLFIGPPGTGKSMLAQRMPGILPPMSEEEALECASIYSLCGRAIDPARWRERPVRGPHHTCSAVALVGGSSIPRPGEVSLAHNGILFLDELPEFERKVIDSLREPMETGKVMISRAARHIEFPARFQLIAAMNPSPLGGLRDKRATPDQVLRYLSRISGPFVDRIDLQVELPKLSSAELQSKSKSESSEQIRLRVLEARQMQFSRQGKANAHLSNKELEVYCPLGKEEASYLAKASDKLSLSPRSYHRLIKVARTIADLRGGEHIKLSDIQETLHYRAFERLIAQLTRY